MSVFHFVKNIDGGYDWVLITCIGSWITLTLSLLATMQRNRTQIAKAVESRTHAEQAQKDEERRRIDAETRLSAAEKEIASLRPKPLPERLRDLLGKIDAKILPALRSGQKKFEGGIPVSQFNALQAMASEAGAARLITVSSDVNMGVGMGPEGVAYRVKFELTDAVLEK